MRRGIPKILVTGGAGFIGSAFVRSAIKKRCKVVVIDKLTYAGDLARLAGLDKKITLFKTDICNRKAVERVFKKIRPQIIVNFAAATHVDRSILDARPFIQTNYVGTQNLLDISRKYKLNKFIQISTDEVYGETFRDAFSEDSPLKPNSPYAASKAAADLLIKSYIRTYNFPAIIVRPCNNYGPWQYPEKLIPLTILRALRAESIPIYGKGINIREWLYVSDCAEAISIVLESGRFGEVYNLGSSERLRNIDLVKKILKILGKPGSLINFVKDRPGHDYRYSLDSSKIRKLGWRPKVDFNTGIRETLNLNMQNLGWLVGKSKYLRRYWKKVYGE